MRIVRLHEGDEAVVLAGAALFDAPPDPEWTARFLAAAGHHLLVALDGQEPLGFVSGVETTHPDKGTEMFLYELSVAAPARRRGIGRSLVEALAALARERGCYGMWVATEPENTAACATYAAAGADPAEACVVFAWRFEQRAGARARGLPAPGALRPNRSVPATTVIPTLIYPDVRAAVAWLEAAFGFRERLQIGEGHRSQLTCGDGAVIAAEVRADRRPPRPGEVSHGGVLVRIEGLDAHCARARAHGARIVSEPESYPYGERQYTAEDLAGHQWTFSETLEDVDPASWGGELRAPAR